MEICVSVITGNSCPQRLEASPSTVTADLLIWQSGSLKVLQGSCRTLRFCESAVFAVVMLVTVIFKADRQHSGMGRASKSETY